MEEHLRPALYKTIQFLEEKGYRYAIIGGVALAQWGVARYTHDIDLKILIPDLKYALARADLHTAFPIRARTQGPQDALIAAVNIDGVIVDFIFALPGYDELVIEQCRSTRPRRLVGVDLLGRGFDCPKSDGRARQGLAGY